MKTPGIVVLLLLLSLMTVTQATEQQKDTPGYSVGYRQVEIASAATNEKFPLALTYPSTTPSQTVNFGPFEMDLSIGGNIATGPFPLVVISHGSGGTNLGYRSMAFTLTRNGYMVAMPLHPKNNFRDNANQGQVSNWRNRPLHIHASIDTLMQDTQLAKHIDDKKVAVIGHSAGGYTALASAGGIADTRHIIERCLTGSNANSEQHSQPKEPFCGLVRENKLDSVIIENARDQRVKAIVMLAPVGVMFKSADSLNAVDIPIFLLRAEHDNELPEPHHSGVVAKNYRHPEKLIHCVVPNAGHYSFITPFPDAVKTQVGLAATDPAGFDRHLFHERLGADIVDFLGEALAGADTMTLVPSSCQQD